MKLEPVGDKVVIRRNESDETSVGGILLPSASQTASLQGRVLSVGDGRLLPCGQRAPMQVREGDRVLFSAYAGTEIQVADERLLIMSEHEILAIFD